MTTHQHWNEAAQRYGRKKPASERSNTLTTATNAVGAELADRADRILLANNILQPDTAQYVAALEQAQAEMDAEQAKTVKAKEPTHLEAGFAYARTQGINESQLARLRGQLLHEKAMQLMGVAEFDPATLDKDGYVAALDAATRELGI